MYATDKRQTSDRRLRPRGGIIIRHKVVLAQHTGGPGGIDEQAEGASRPNRTNTAATFGNNEIAMAVDIQFCRRRVSLADAVSG